MAEAARRRQQSRRSDDAGDEHGLRGLVGAGPSQVGVSGALRARDAARPTEADEAAAERAVRVVRRNYVPPSGPGTSAEPGRSGNSPERS
ncbi:MAG: hypothetical protein DLM59_20395 [Pseudonocardiales bacterium]|nr:MAG: hypothetical protein DLM59_20395 [Pseudonocardiales bacterium]